MDRQKENLIIVDNSILSFAFDLANGVPINSYMGDDPQDKDLLYLYSFCEQAFYDSDVRKSCDESFKLRYILQSITGKADVWNAIQNNQKCILEGGWMWYCYFNELLPRKRSLWFAFYLNDAFHFMTLKYIF